MNRLVVVGTLSKKPVQRSTSNGGAMVTFNILSTEIGWSGYELKVYISGVIFGRPAENFAADEGDMVMAAGKLKASSYEKNGDKVWVLDLEADSVVPVKKSVGDFDTPDDVPF